MVRTLGLVVAMLAGCDGNETNLNQVYPDLVVLPESVEFGDVTVGYSSGVDITVVNAGLATLELESASITGTQAAAFTVDQGGPLSLTNDESVTFHVTFGPDTYLPFAAALELVSNDPTHPVFTVPLTGTGTYAPTPDIELDPPTVDFGSVAVGSVGVQTLAITNTGGATLTLGAVKQTGSGAFVLQGLDPGGFSIPPGQSQQLVWVYTPYTDQGDNGAYLIPSNDPDQPELTVPLLGNGGGDFEYPEAVIDCPTDVEPRQLVLLDGRASTDPDGLPLTYKWTLDGIPLGSAVTQLLDSTRDVAQFTTDVAGEYVVGLTVTNTNGTSSAKRTCKMDAVPKEQLHVELSWDTSAADVDLHLIEDDGEFFVNPGDCNFCNQVPDWGVAFEGDDNASLDIDDISGMGPENINVDVPAGSKYRVLVHYFNDHGDASLNATLRVYAFGVLVAEASHEMEYNYTWEFGQVNWPAGTVGVTDIYRQNLVYDDAGAPILDEDGNEQTGPMQCR